MTPETIYRVSQDAMIVAIKLTVPVLLPSLAIGLIIAMFQAATQINESTLTFVPKLIIIGLVLLLMGPWMLQVFLIIFRH
jgi:flagellar biosynthetic protein FliQ